MKGIFDAYVLWRYGKKNISELVMRVSTRTSKVHLLLNFFFQMFYLGIHFCEQECCMLVCLNISRSILPTLQ